MTNNKNIYIYYELLKGLVFCPAKTFHDIAMSRFDTAIYFFFCSSYFISLFKSLGKRSVRNNFFENQVISDILSFINIPQVQLVIALFAFALFIFLVCKISGLFVNNGNNKNLFLCLLSISCIGLLLHLLFLVSGFIFSQKILHLFRYISFLWIFFLSVLAIKEIKNLSYVKAIVIFVTSGFPSVLMMGFSGLAPYLLWLY